MSTEQTTQAPEGAAEATKAPEAATTLALRDVSTNLATFDAVEAGLQELEKKYTNVAFAITTTAGLKEAKEARLAIRKPRFAVQNVVKDSKSQLRALSMAIGARGDAIIARLTPLESPIDAQIEAEEKRQADAKAERERVEAERKAGIEALVAEIRDCLTQCVGQDAAYIGTWVEWLDANPVTEELFQERTAEATALHANTRTMVGTMHAQAVQLEAQQAELQARQQAEAAAKALDDKLNAIRVLPMDLVEASAEALREKLAELDAMSADEFGDRVDEASELLDSVGEELRDLLNAAEQEEAADAAALVAEVQSAAAPAPAAEAQVANTTHEPAATPVVAAAPVAGRYTGRFANAANTTRTVQRPTDSALINAVAMHFRVSEDTACTWLREIDFTAHEGRLSAERFAA